MPLKCKWCEVKSFSEAVWAAYWSPKMLYKWLSYRKLSKSSSEFYWFRSDWMLFNSIHFYLYSTKTIKLCQECLWMFKHLKRSLLAEVAQSIMIPMKWEPDISIVPWSTSWVDAYQWLPGLWDGGTQRAAFCWLCAGKGRGTAGCVRPGKPIWSQERKARVRIN